MPNSQKIRKKRKKIHLFSHGNEKGIITVLVSLLLVPVILFTGLMVDFARIKSFEAQATFAADMYGNSILASYNNELYDMYALFGFTPNEELEAELKKIAESSVTGDYVVTEQGVKGLVNMLQQSFNPEQAAQAMDVFGNGEVSFDYSVAVSGGQKGDLGNDDIFKAQIADYTVTRLPTLLVEGAVDGKHSEIEDIMSAVDTVKNLDKYSKITSIKGKLDAKLEVFFNFLTAYNDDLYSLSSNNFSDNDKWLDYSRDYGEYGTEELREIIGEYEYQNSKIVTQGLDFDDETYLETVAVAHQSVQDKKDEIWEYIDAIANYYCVDSSGEGPSEYFYFENGDDDVLTAEDVETKMNEIKAELEKDNQNGILYRVETNLNNVDHNLTKIIRRVTDSNAYTAVGSPMKLKNLEWARNMPEVGKKLDEKKKDINSLIIDLYAARKEAIDGGCDVEIIDEMIGDYSSVQMLTSDGFSYEQIAQNYHDMLMDFKNSVLGDGGIMRDDLKLIETDVSYLISLCDMTTQFAKDQIEADGVLSVDSQILELRERFSEIKSYNAYKLDKYDFFGHIGDADFYNYDAVPLYGINNTSFYFMSEDETVVELVSNTDGGEQKRTAKIKDICEYIKKSFTGNEAGTKKKNGILKKAKKLLNELDGVDLNVYEDNDIVIGDAVYGTLSSTKAAEAKQGSSLADMLNNIDKFFPDINLTDILTNMILMMYDYNMFSCDTTDKIPKENTSKNKLSADKSGVVGSGGKLELGEGIDECTALANLAGGGDSSSSSSSGSSGSSHESNTNAFYTDNKDGGTKDSNGKEIDPEESMTDYCYAETSTLYRCELEYLYSGNKVMQKNLDNTRMTIIAERMIFNYLSTYTTKDLNRILNSIKNAVSTAFTPAIGIVTDGVLRLAIAALEANSDMTQLLSGDTVVLIKSEFAQFSSYDMIKDFLSSASDDEGYDVDVNKKETSSTKKFPEINLNYKQYLMLNILLFTNKDDLLNRTRDLIDLNVNSMEKNIEVKDNTVVFAGDTNADSEDYFNISEQITVINSQCSVKMSPLFTSMGVEKLTGDSEKVNEFFTDKRTYSVTKGY